jgi:hypothetical protein
MTELDDVTQALLAERFAGPAAVLDHDGPPPDDEPERVCSSRRRVLLAALDAHEGRGA